MYVKVRTMDGTQTAVLTISKLTSIEDFRGMVEEKMNVAKNRQRLFYRGKQVSTALLCTYLLIILTTYLKEAFVVHNQSRLLCMLCSEFSEHGDIAVEFSIFVRIT